MTLPLHHRLRLTLRSGLTVAVALALAIVCQAHADAYPTRPVTMVVPTGAGGGMELLARILAQRLEQRLGAPFVIVNRPGASGTIGTMEVVRAAPDGYTLLVANTAYLAINPTLYKKLPYDPVKQLAPIAMDADSPWVLVVNPSLPVHSLTEFIQYAKSKPGQLTYGSGGPGSVTHMFGAMLQARTGIDVRHIPYRGTLEPLFDVVAGRLDFMFSDIPPSLQLIKSGKLRALGVSPARAAVAPEIPVLSDELPGFAPLSWHMIVAPAGTPGAIVNTLNSQIRDIVADPAVKHQFEAMGQIPIETEPPDKLEDFIKSEIVRWKAIVQQAGVAGSE